MKEKTGYEEARVAEALEINAWLASLYARKSGVDRSEFVSAGHLGIAKAVCRLRQGARKVTNGNWGGYVKVCIQNEMITVCRRQKRRDKMMRRAWSVYYAYRDSLGG